MSNDNYIQMPNNVGSMLDAQGLTLSNVNDTSDKGQMTYSNGRIYLDGAEIVTSTDGIKNNNQQGSYHYGNNSLVTCQGCYSDNLILIGTVHVKSYNKAVYRCNSCCRMSFGVPHSDLTNFLSNNGNDFSFDEVSFTKADQLNSHSYELGEIKNKLDSFESKEDQTRNSIAQLHMALDKITRIVEDDIFERRNRLPIDDLKGRVFGFELK